MPLRLQLPFVSTGFLIAKACIVIDPDHIGDDSDNDDVGEIPAKPTPKVEEMVNGRGKRKAAVEEVTNGPDEEEEGDEEEEEEL